MEDKTINQKRYFRATDSFEKGDFITALDLVEIVLENDPEHLYAIHLRGCISGKNKQYEKAIEDFDKIIKKFIKMGWKKHEVYNQAVETKKTAEKRIRERDEKTQE